MRAANESKFDELEKKLGAIDPHDIVDKIAGARLKEIQGKLDDIERLVSQP